MPAISSVRPATSGPSKRTRESSRRRRSRSASPCSGRTRPRIGGPRRKLRETSKTWKSFPDFARTANVTERFPNEREPLTLNQLESHLWEAANILRGPVDAADFKSYVFPLLFIKRNSDERPGLPLPAAPLDGGSVWNMPEPRPRDIK